MVVGSHSRIRILLSLCVGAFLAGATLIQFYTGMVYRGPELVAECVTALAAAK